MTPKNHFTQISTGILLAIAFLTFAVPAQVYAQSALSNLPNLSAFIENVKNGNANALRGVYVTNVMSYPIVQQPEGNAHFVSTNDSVVTQFSMATSMGNVGLLAHNTLAGKSFFNIKQSDQIILVYGDGHTETFVVENTLSYQSLPYGQYKNLQTQNNISVGEIFNTVYGGEYHLTLQTCIERDGNFEWGRMFIIAKPVLNFIETHPSK